MVANGIAFCWPNLFAKTANTIVLDEPTNDLDAETLELLEAKLVEFDGTVLVVSHDREFLNNVVTSTLVFESDGLHEYVGGYDDYLRQRPPDVQPEKPKTATRLKPKSPIESAQGKRRLSYNEQRELDRLPAKIEALETKISELHEAMAAPDYYQQPPAELAADQDNLKSLESELETAFERWQELE